MIAGRIIGIDSLVRLMAGGAILLFACSALRAQPAIHTKSVETEVVEAVRQSNEAALLNAIKKPAGRQALFVLCDDNFVFEMHTARILASILQEPGEDRIFARQTAISLLHQSDNETVVQELLN